MTRDKGQIFSIGLSLSNIFDHYELSDRVILFFFEKKYNNTIQDLGARIQILENIVIKSVMLILVYI